MSIVGTWKMNAIRSYETGELMSLEDFVNEIPGYINANNAEDVAHEKSQRQMQVDSVLNITADGMIETLMPIPSEYTKEQIDAAVADGEIELRGDMMLVETIEWKEEAGKNYFANGTVTVDGETKTAWEEIACEDGKLELNGMVYVCE